MNNSVNLGFLLQAPAVLDQNTPASPNSASGTTLFANLLMQQMNGASAGSGADLNGFDGNGPGGMFGPDNSNLAGLGLPGFDLAGLNLQGIGGNQGSLASLLPLLKALQSQLSAKASLPGNPLQINQDGDQNSSPTNALAVWLAALAAQQNQPNMQNLAVGQSDLRGLPGTGAGIGDPRVLRAIEKFISQIEQSEAGKGSGKGITTGPAEKIPATAAPETGDPEKAVPVTNAPNTIAPEKIIPATLEGKTGEAEKVTGDAKNEQKIFAAIEQSVSAAAHATKPAGTDAKAQSDLSGKPTTNNPAQDTLPVAPQNQTPNSNTQGQSSSQSEGSRSGNGDSHKGNSSAEQFAALLSGQSATVNATSHGDQNNLAAVISPVAHSASGNANSPAGSGADTSSTPNVRDIAAAGPVEHAAPRVVNESQMMQAAGQAEMHVTVKTESAGTVDIRAMLEGNHISATVASQHSATRDWLVSNLSDLHTSLNRDNLQLRTFEVTDSALQSDPRNSGSGQQDQQQQQQPMRSQYRQEFQQAAGLTEDIDLNQTESASRALSLLA